MRQGCRETNVVPARLRPTVWQALPNTFEGPQPVPMGFSYQHGCTRQPGASRCSELSCAIPWFVGPGGQEPWAQEVTIKIVFLMLKNEAGGGEDRINEGWPGSAPPPTGQRPDLPLTAGVCVCLCACLCVCKTWMVGVGYHLGVR